MIEKDEDLPVIDPQAPEIYKLLIDEAAKVRAKRKAKNDFKRIVKEYLNEKRMRELREYEEKTERAKNK